MFLSPESAEGKGSAEGMRRRFCDEELTEIFDKTAGLCRYCGKQLSWSNYGRVGSRGAWEVDHSVPVSRGGTDYYRNLWPACVFCNTDKGTLTGSEYMRDEAVALPTHRGVGLGEILGGPVIAGLGLLVLNALSQKPDGP